MTKQDFRVNYILSADLVDKETILSDFFDSAFEQIDSLRQIKDEKSDNTLTVAYLDNLAFAENELQYAKNNARIDVVEKGIQFSYPIRQSDESFNEKDENGQFGWLRQHIFDCIHYYAIPVMLEKSFNINQKLSYDVCTRLKNHFFAFHKVFNCPVDEKNKLFWISGE